MYITITIDGTSGAGKSSVARTLSCRYNIPCLNSGAMFRTLAHKTITLFPEKHYSEINVKEILNAIESATFTLLYEDNTSVLLFNEEPLPSDIHTETIAEITSHIASYGEVRSYLRNIQRMIASTTHLIAEGRDMGTIVFPNASIKIFLTASIEERAKRRYYELKKHSSYVNYYEVLQQLIERDKKDSTRTESPLKPAHDALLLDTTNSTVDEILDAIQNYMMSKDISFNDAL